MSRVPLNVREKLVVGDTVRSLTGGSLMLVEGFEPCERNGKIDEEWLVKCVVDYTDDRPDSVKERNTFPRHYLEKWRSREERRRDRAKRRRMEAQIESF